MVGFLFSRSESPVGKYGALEFWFTTELFPYKTSLKTRACVNFFCVLTPPFRYSVYRNFMPNTGEKDSARILYSNYGTLSWLKVFYSSQSKGTNLKLLELTQPISQFLSI